MERSLEGGTSNLVSSEVFCEFHVNDHPDENLMDGLWFVFFFLWFSSNCNSLFQDFFQINNYHTSSQVNHLVGRIEMQNNEPWP